MCRPSLVLRTSGAVASAAAALLSFAALGCSSDSDTGPGPSPVSQDAQADTSNDGSSDAQGEASHPDTTLDSTDAIVEAVADEVAVDSPTSDAAEGGGSPSGESMPVGDLPGWHQVFADDFTTDVPLGSFPDAVSQKWGAYADGWKDTSKNGTYFPSKVVSIAQGMMNVHLHTEGGVHMVSAQEPKIPGATGSSGGMLYGRYAIRFRAEPVAGYKTAWLLWPDSGNWPNDGEIDFPEGDLDGTISAFMHRQNATSGSDQDAYSTSATYGTWHTAVLEWSSAQCRFILDGTPIGTSTNRIPNTAMHWVIQTETALSGGPPSDAAQGNVQIDWVAVWVPQ